MPRKTGRSAFAFDLIQSDAFKFLHLTADLSFADRCGADFDVGHYLADDVFNTGLVEIGDNDLFGVGIGIGTGKTEKSLPATDPEACCDGIPL